MKAKEHYAKYIGPLCSTDKDTIIEAVDNLVDGFIAETKELVKARNCYADSACKSVIREQNQK